jgi:hypothetical protein
MVRDQPEGIARPTLSAADRMEKSGVRTRDDHRMRAACIEPPRRMIITQPFGHKNRVVRHPVAAGQHIIHVGCFFANVIVIDPVQTRNNVLFQPRNIVRSKSRVGDHPGMSHYNSIRPLLQVESHAPVVELQAPNHLGCPLVGASPGSCTGT